MHYFKKNDESSYRHNNRKTILYIFKQLLIIQLVSDKICHGLHHTHMVDIKATIAFLRRCSLYGLSGITFSNLDCLVIT